MTDTSRRRRVLEEFNRNGSVMAALPLDDVLAWLRPARRRWAAVSPLILRVDRTQTPETDPTMDPTTITENLSKIEQRLAAGKVAPEVLRAMVANITLPNFGDQSKNDAFMNLGKPKVDTVPEGGWTPPASVTHPKVGSLSAFEANTAAAEDILAKVAAIQGRVASIEASRKASGKGGFAADRARLDLHHIASRVAYITEHVDLGAEWVAPEFTTLANKTAQMYALFFPAGK